MYRNEAQWRLTADDEWTSCQPHNLGVCVYLSVCHYTTFFSITRVLLSYVLQTGLAGPPPRSTAGLSVGANSTAQGGGGPPKKYTYKELEEQINKVTS